MSRLFSTSTSCQGALSNNSGKMILVKGIPYEEAEKLVWPFECN